MGGGDIRNGESRVYSPHAPPPGVLEQAVRSACHAARAHCRGCFAVSRQADAAILPPEAGGKREPCASAACHPDRCRVLVQSGWGPGMVAAG